jgi:hypothetical protein
VARPSAVRIRSSQAARSRAPAAGGSACARQRPTAALTPRTAGGTITPEGIKALEAVDAVLGSADDDLFVALSPDERIQLERLLEKVADTESCSDKY